MESTAYYPGSIGEIIQGNMGGIDVLTSCPVNLYTKVRVFESSCQHNHFKNYKANELMFNMLKRWNYEKFIQELNIDICSQIPIGKGFASSTADLCALYNALLKLFKRKFNEKELIEECLRLEPTDSIIFKEMTLFDYKNGTFKKTIGKYMEFYVLVFEGKTRVNTIEFNKKVLPEQKDISDLAALLMEAVEERNLIKLAHCSTESILRNQHRLKYNFLDNIFSIMNKIDGLGVIGAHSGNCLGIILEDLEKFNYCGNNKILKNYNTYLVKAINL